MISSFSVVQRFRYYDCLLVPRSSLIGQFPWHRVNLLVEYEHTGDTLHPTTTSIEYIVLKCTSDVFPGLAGSPVIQINQGMYVGYLKSYESVRKQITNAFLSISGQLYTELQLRFL